MFSTLKVRCRGHIFACVMMAQCILIHRSILTLGCLVLGLLLRRARCGGYPGRIKSNVVVGPTAGPPRVGAPWVEVGQVGLPVRGGHSSGVVMVPVHQALVSCLAPVDILMQISLLLLRRGEKLISRVSAGL